MNDPVAVALQFGFLAVLFLFIAWVVISARRELVRGGNVDVQPAGGDPNTGGERSR